MKTLFRRPALALACLGALFGLWHIAMSVIYRAQVDVETIRMSLGAVVLFVTADIVALIIEHYLGGSDG